MRQFRRPRHKWKYILKICMDARKWATFIWLRQVAGPYEHHNEHSDSTTCREFLD
jgi:hypothetical protein